MEPDARAVFDHPRNLRDAQLRELAARDGLFGVILVPFALDPADLSTRAAVDHVEHAVEVMGVEHVCFGSDFMYRVMLTAGHRPPPGSGLPTDPEEAVLERVRGPEHYGVLAAALRERGVGEADLSALLGGNLLRFLCRLPSGS